jgi:hypothetical protein
LVEIATKAMREEQEDPASAVWRYASDPSGALGSVAGSTVTPAQPKIIVVPDAGSAREMGFVATSAI